MVFRGTPINPRWLWPTVFASSGAIHLALLVFRPWHLVQQATTPNTPVPIQIVETLPSSEPAETDSAAIEPPTDVTSEPSDASSLPDQPASPEEPDSAIPPESQSLSVPPTTQPTPTVSPPPQNIPQPTSPQPTVLPPPADLSNPSPPSNPASPNPAPPHGNDDSASSPSGGQLIPLGIRADPQGRDLPDQQPQITQSTIPISPLLAGCGWPSAPRLETTTATMRLTVEADGSISRTAMLTGTGDPSIDDLIQCLVKQGMQLKPATSLGEAHPTDTTILQIKAQF